MNELKSVFFLTSDKPEKNSKRSYEYTGDYFIKLGLHHHLHLKLDSR